ncbi:MAG: 30S ribosomal protein S6e, partial [Candidatus Undinarchaeales archaeon]
MAFKLVINNPKDGKSYQMDFEDKSKLIGKKLGEKISGSDLGLSGYELKITGGSDACGNPMRSDVDGSSARRLILSGGAGLNPKEEGERRKKRIHGRTIAGDIIQINLKVVKSGSKKLSDLISSGEESEKKEESEKEPEPKPKSEVEKKEEKK